MRLIPNCLLSSAVLSLSLCFLLSGCSTDSVAERHGLGEGPSLDRSFDIKGSDADANGIRDDVEAYINSTYKDPAQRQAIKQYAKSLQREALVNYQSIEDHPRKRKKKKIESEEELNQKIKEAKLAVIETSRAVACVFERFEGNFVESPTVVIIEMNSFMQNTMARSTAVDTTRAMAGNYSSSINNTFKRNCD